MSKELPVIFDIFRGKKPISLAFIPRVPMFDPIGKVGRKSGELFIHRFRYKDLYITIKRPQLSALDQKVFYTLLKTGKFVKELHESYEFHYNFAEFKEVAGINKATRWMDVENSLDRLSSITMYFETKTEEFKRVALMRRAINNFDILESNKKEITFFVRFSKEFMSLVETSTLFSLPLNQLKQLNELRNPVVYRVISFFITQHKKQSWELFSLLKRLTAMQFDTKKKRHRILKSIQENEELLKQYGITISEKKEGKYKTYILNFQKPKSLNVELGKHIPVANG